MKRTNRDEYTLQRLSPTQWEEYKAIRLEALKTNPEMFGRSYGSEVVYNQHDWISLLEKETRAIFALYHINSLIGLCGVGLKEDEPSTAILFSSFIKMAHRGKGLSKLFYEARINWARQNNCSAIVVSHRVGNDLSKAANQRFGFQYTHTNEVTWPDGALANELNYSLKL